MKAGDPGTRPVVQKDRGLGVEAPFQKHTSPRLSHEVWACPGKAGGRQRAGLFQPRLQGFLLSSPSELPCAERGGEQHDRSERHHGQPANALHQSRPARVRETLCGVKIIIALAFVAIIGSLGSALFFMMRDKGRTRNTARALGLRVAFSIALFLFILLSNQLGWIESHGIQVGPR